MVVSKKMFPILQKLCIPSSVYFIISVLSLLIIGFQNLNNTNKYCLGSYTCEVSSTLLVFAVKLIWVVFWTWVLNLICKSGHTNISWFLLLLPYISLFLILLLILF